MRRQVIEMWRDVRNEDDIFVYLLALRLHNIGQVIIILKEPYPEFEQIQELLIKRAEKETIVITVIKDYKIRWN